MPSLVKEVTQGHSKSQTGGGVDVQGSGSAARVFRVILNDPGEVFDAPNVCGVSLGSLHPNDQDYYCTDYTATYEGDSRKVVNVTFNYAFAQKNGGDQNQPPDIRPANWSLGSSLMEMPCRSWKKMLAADRWGAWGVPENTAGDIYDNVTTYDPIVTITITQYCVSDPTRSATFVGQINEEKITLGSLIMEPHTVMLRSVQSNATVESFGGTIYRGWTAVWEFAFRENYTYFHYAGDDKNPVGAPANNQGEFLPIGWDIAVPLTGMSVKAVDPAPYVDANFKNKSNIDVYAQPLRHGKEGTDFYGRIETPLKLPDGVEEGSKQRAMVRVFSYENGGASQTPSALPVPLNEDGTPRNTERIDENTRYYPIVWRYQVYPELNFTRELGLRLY